MLYSLAQIVAFALVAGLGIIVIGALVLFLRPHPPSVLPDDDESNA